MTFDPLETSRLATELAEDDERATPAPWLVSVEHECVETSQLGGDGDVYGGYLWRPDWDDESREDRVAYLRRDGAAFARLRNNARAASEQLRAALDRIGELERLAIEACDLASAAAYLKHEGPEWCQQRNRVGEIRAAAVTGRAREVKESLSVVRARHGFAPLSSEKRAENLEANLADLSPRVHSTPVHASRAFAWKCTTCGSWWVHGTIENEQPPRRCYGDCGGTDFERHEIVSTTASSTGR